VLSRRQGLRPVGTLEWKWPPFKKKFWRGLMVIVAHWIRGDDFRGDEPSGQAEANHAGAKDDDGRLAKSKHCNSLEDHWRHCTRTNR
jgi:hypothetical protein